MLCHEFKSLLMAHRDLSSVQLGLELLDQVTALLMSISKQLFDRFQGISRFLISLLFIHKLALLYVLDLIALIFLKTHHSHNWAHSGAGRPYSYTFVLRK